jgi:hypothetical protein
MSLNREFLIWKERGRVSRSVGRHFQGLVRFGRDRVDRQRYREIDR